MFRFRRFSKSDDANLSSSTLYDQDTFDRAFMRDLTNCRKELVIECPFITWRRMNELLPALAHLRGRGVQIVINTRHPDEHDEPFSLQAEEAINRLHDLDVTVLYTKGHHRKIAVIDRCVVWEGSLNILSFNDSCEIMRRITSDEAAKQMIMFLKVDKYLEENLHGRL